MVSRWCVDRVRLEKRGRERRVAVTLASDSDAPFPPALFEANAIDAPSGDHAIVVGAGAWPRVSKTDGSPPATGMMTAPPLGNAAAILMPSSDQSSSVRPLPGSD